MVNIEFKNKITKATFNKFVKENNMDLFIKCISSFDSMQDCIATNVGPWRGLTKKNYYNEEVKQCSIKNTLGYDGIWLVGSSRDYFKKYDDEHFIGIEVDNCCGSFIVALPKGV